MLTVRFEEHSEEIFEKLKRKLFAAVAVAAESLADGYKSALQRQVAPPHSGVGEIPHAYFGWKQGGYGPTNSTGINNIPPEFSAEQTAFLSEYISHGAVEEFGAHGFIGFETNGHVGNRNENYLIYHDQNGRPWVLPVFDQEKSEMAARAKSAFERTG